MLQKFITIIKYLQGRSSEDSGFALHIFSISFASIFIRGAIPAASLKYGG